MTSSESPLAGRGFSGFLSCSFSLQCPLCHPEAPVFTKDTEGGELVSRLVSDLRLVVGTASDLEFPCMRSSGGDIMHILQCGSLSAHKCQWYAQETKEGK